MSRPGDAAVGMMDAAYFTGRRELLDFFNNLLALNLNKIEETASGAVACQLTEYIFPNSIPMSRVNWSAKTDYEYVNNYKLLQSAFSKNGVSRYVDVPKLIKGRYQDNLEFCQWLKAFYEQSGAYRENYDPVAVRAKGKGGKGKAVSSSASRSRPVSKPTTRRPTTSTSRPAPKNMSSQGKENKGTGKTTRSADPMTDAVLADANLIKKNSDLSKKLLEMEATLVEVEKERDFYFEKLRDVEVMLQVHQETPDEERNPDRLVEKVFKVLYATAEDKIQVNDDGEIVGEEEEDDHPVEVPNHSVDAEAELDELLTEV